MGHTILKQAITFDDVLIRPAKSSVEPGDASPCAQLVRGLSCPLPIMSAAMDKVTEGAMAGELGRLGGMGVIHRSCTVAQQVKMVAHAKKQAAEGYVAAAIGPFDGERALALEEAGADAISIDCAHGHNAAVVKSARRIKKQLTRAALIVGNIGTGEAAKELVNFADAIKVGIGPGSICTTRSVSGVGVPQLSAIIEAVAVARPKGVPVIADGGIRTSGDIAKALAAGASGVMLGNLLAATSKAPGRKVRAEGKVMKEYRGMGSRAVHNKNISSDRYLSKSTTPVPEGVEALVPYKGETAEVVGELVQGVSVAMAYVGAATLDEFYERAQFIQISPATTVENNPHSLGKITG